MEKPDLNKISHQLGDAFKYYANMERCLDVSTKYLKIIRQEGIDNSDSVEAATKMTDLAIEALNYLDTNNE